MQRRITKKNGVWRCVFTLLCPFWDDLSLIHVGYILLEELSHDVVFGHRLLEKKVDQKMFNMLMYKMKVCIQLSLCCIWMIQLSHVTLILVRLSKVGSKVQDEGFQFVTPLSRTRGVANGQVDVCHLDQICSFYCLGVCDG